MKPFKLLTKEVAKLVPPLHSGDRIPVAQKVCPLKFFGPGRWTWYVTEASPVTPDDGPPVSLASVDVRFIGDVEFFGYVVSGLGPDCDEWGPFFLSELRTLRFPLKVGGTVIGRAPVERDAFWRPQRMCDALPEAFGRVLPSPLREPLPCIHGEPGACPACETERADELELVVAAATAKIEKGVA